MTVASPYVVVLGISCGLAGAGTGRAVTVVLTYPLEPVIPVLNTAKTYSRPGSTVIDACDRDPSPENDSLPRLELPSTNSAPWLTRHVMSYPVRQTMDLSPLRVAGLVHSMSTLPGCAPGVAVRLVTGFSTEGVWLLDSTLL